MKLTDAESAELERIIAGLRPKLYYEWSLIKGVYILTGGMSHRIYRTNEKKMAAALAWRMEAAGFFINLKSIFEGEMEEI